MYKVSHLRDTITETWYFVYLLAYEVSHRRDLALTDLQKIQREKVVTEKSGENSCPKTLLPVDRQH